MGAAAVFCIIVSYFVLIPLADIGTAGFLYQLSVRCDEVLLTETAAATPPMRKSTMNPGL